MAIKLEKKSPHHHYAMHKPALCLSSTCDLQPRAKRSTTLRRQRSLEGGHIDDGVDAGAARRTIVDVLRDCRIDPAQVSAVGRLDYETSGLLLFTSDGALNRRLRAKEAGVHKVYVLDVAGRLGVDAVRVARLREPLRYSDAVRTDPAQIEWVEARALAEGAELAADPWPWPPHGGWSTRLHVTLAEGKQRQIRRLCQRSKLHVRKLHRVAVGPQQLGALAPGACRALNAAEVDALYAACSG